ncbi:MAG: circularly permuted type 2 ATP-grasp protein [Alphaproteobacteria bacterium]|nr:circularly permuted type 2 ATP-grasp protein [Alphaproteobacteria bacterium]
MDAFDEMRGPNGTVAEAYQAVAEWLYATPSRLLDEKRREAEILFRRIGITFNVYGEDAGTERLIPFDIIPRSLAPWEWTKLSRGLEQRVRALDAFLADIYHEQEILKAGKIPSHKVLGNVLYRPEMQGIEVPGGVYVQIAGIDVVRTEPDRFFVLEDNLRTPSGVSYMLEDRAVMMRLFPDLFAKAKVAPIDHYPHELLRTLRSVCPAHAGADPVVVLLTPGPYNSAYFEHAFLAERMGIELVEGQDLFVQDDAVFMRTTLGPRRVDVIYRRLDDEFIDPLAFNPDSSLGVPGLLSVYRKGGVTLANAIGTGVADDKSIYPYVPDMIRFYLGEDPLLENVPTWLLERPEDLAYALDHLPELVVKETQGSGGYGMLVGPKSSKQEIEDFRQKIKANPEGYIAQPTLALSTCPTFTDEGIAPRHVDLRPFILHGKNSISMVPGGLTRVALRQGSLVVNSSQGGGTKDTWVLEE